MTETESRIAALEAALVEVFAELDHGALDRALERLVSRSPADRQQDEVRRGALLVLGQARARAHEVAASDG
jgi:hypothetical protein